MDSPTIPPMGSIPEINRDVAIKLLTKFGGHFLSSIGKSLQYADRNNTSKIFAMWGNDIQNLYLTHSDRMD